ncbi:MAG TPA: hypothetical protein VJX67_13965, partial [Blastocatellia bacterium]|nr:hypothetical protein [Blastocatellia bacterium]
MPEESGSLPGENGGMTRLADYLDDRYRGRGEIDLGKRGALDAGDVARVVGGCGADAEQSYRVQWRLARDRFVA